MAFRLFHFSDHKKHFDFIWYSVCTIQKSFHRIKLYTRQCIKISTLFFCVIEIKQKHETLQAPFSITIPSNARTASINLQQSSRLIHQYDDALHKYFFQYCENLVIKHAIENKHITFYIRYVDDILKIYDHNKINSEQTLTYTCTDTIFIFMLNPNIK